MGNLVVRPMTSAEFEAFRSRLVREYAAEHVRAGNWTADEAEARSAEQTAELLPQGVETPGMLLLMAETAGGEPVGHLWVALERRRGFPGAWIYAIEIAPDQRGKGYGRALLLAAEQATARRGWERSASTSSGRTRPPGISTSRPATRSPPCRCTKSCRSPTERRSPGCDRSSTRSPPAAASTAPDRRVRPPTVG